MAAQSFVEGLEGVVAAQSAICTVDGQAGRLIYRGYDIGDLANWSTFEETTYLLWFGELPTRSQLERFTRDLAAVRAVPEPALDLLRRLPRGAAELAGDPSTADASTADASTAMDVLRTMVSALGLYDAEAADGSRDANVRKATRLTAQTATLVAAQHRLQQGQEPVAPNPRLSHAANFLWMLSGREPPSDHARILDVALILHADHELNASTFAARVTAATLSDLYSAATSAVGTLKGPLHGGANEAVIRMLLEIDRPERVEPFIQGELAAKRRIPGFGHRVYRTWDPRALVLRDLMCELEAAEGRLRWCGLARQVAETVWQAKRLYPNVDFYSAPLYHTLGIPIELYTPVFAVSRMAGWTAHILEQYAHNRLIRPRAEYTGPLQAVYVPLEQRREARGDQPNGSQRG